MLRAWFVIYSRECVWCAGHRCYFYRRSTFDIFQLFNLTHFNLYNFAWILNAAPSGLDLDVLGSIEARSISTLHDLLPKLYFSTCTICDLAILTLDGRMLPIYFPNWIADVISNLSILIRWIGIQFCIVYRSACTNFMYMRLKLSTLVSLE